MDDVTAEEQNTVPRPSVQQTDTMCPQSFAAIGQVVVDAASLEYSVAVLVAVTEGLRDEDCEERALEIVKRTGEAMRQLSQLARRRPDLERLRRDAEAVLDDRHIIAHSIPLDEDSDGSGQARLTIWHPRSARETQITTTRVLSHAHDIRIVFRRFHDAIAAATADL